MIQERENTKIVTENHLLKLAVYSIFSKKARTELSKAIKKISIETKARPGLFE